MSRHVRIPSTVLLKRARQLIAEVQDWQCESCTKMLEEHEKRYCWQCGEYWKDVDNGLFDEPISDVGWGWR